MSAPRDPGLSALIVDPSQFQRGVLAGLARAAGVTRLLLAESTDEALALLPDGVVSVVIIDFTTKPLDACGFARHVRASSNVSIRAVPMIVLMARATRADVQAAREAGINAVLMKPCSQAMLQDKITAVLAEVRPFVVSAEYVGPCRRRRAEAGYRGPLRRMTDPKQSREQGDGPLYTPPKLLTDAVTRLSACAMTLGVGEGGVQQVLSRALQVRAAALEVGDGDAADGANELLRYLEGVGATSRLAPQAVQVHIEALNQIIALPPTDRLMRLRLSEGLRRLVTKKLNAAAAL
jgi:CheY-like chemotaxis protein